MSEKILKALLQLFAIIAKREGDDVEVSGQGTVERFLRRLFTQQVVKDHLLAFEEYTAAFHFSGEVSQRGRKRTSVNSVKVLKICTEVNEELNQRQKFIVLVHLLELVHEDGGMSSQEEEFVSTVAEVFNIAQEEFRRCNTFVQGSLGLREDASDLLYVDDAVRCAAHRPKHFDAHGLVVE